MIKAYHFLKIYQKYMSFNFTICLLFILLNSSESSKNRIYNWQTMCQLPASKTKDSIWLFNKSGVELKFSYEDKFLDRHLFHLLPDSSYRFFADEIQILTQTNLNQNFYILYPGDTLYANVSQKGNAIFSVRNDPIRNNELNLQWKINEETPLNFFKVFQIREKYFDVDYKKVDSVYLTDYKSKIHFINEYIKSYPVSPDYELRIKDYYKALLLSSELWLGTKSKDKISPSFFNYLDSAGMIIDNTLKAIPNPLYKFLKFGFIRYQLRTLSNSDVLLDSLYERSKHITNNQIRQLTLLKIVKEELSEKHPPYQLFLNDFIHNQADSGNKKYIELMAYNNSLMYSATDTDVLLDVADRQISYDSLKQSLRGNILYIDIWASWCAPCRAEMPESAKLREKYKGEKIKMIYLSIDDNIMVWKEATRELKLDGYSYSFLLLNAQKTDFIKHFRIGSIPRYILIGKDGVVSNSNAPRPNDTSISKVIESLLTNLQ